MKRMNIKLHKEGKKLRRVWAIKPVTKVKVDKKKKLVYDGNNKWRKQIDATERD